MGKDLTLVAYTHIVNDVCISFISKVTKLDISRLKNESIQRLLNANKVHWIKVVVQILLRCLLTMF